MVQQKRGSGGGARPGLPPIVPATH